MTNPVSILSIFVTVVLGGVLLLWVRHRSSSGRGESKSGARIPEGSFGWPIIGETLTFARDPVAYGASHVKRYGKIFKSSLFLEFMVLGATPEFAKFVTTNSSLVVGYPRNVTDVMGPKSLLFQNGPRHTAIKKIVQKLFLPESLRTQVNVLETIVLEHIASWEQKGTIIATEATHKITIDTSIWLLLGLRDLGRTPEGKKVMENFQRVNTAISSVPVNIPGTTFNKGLKANAALIKYFKHLLEERKAQGNSQANLLGVLLAAKEDPQVLEELEDFNNDLIADNLLQFWLAAYDSTAMTLTWVLKFLVENPEIFRRIQAEQQEICKSKSPNGLSWEDYKNMVYTQKFFQEVQRSLSIVSASLRKTTEDVEFEGYLIPKGWAVCALNQCIHSDPVLYPDPEKLDPERFNVPPKAYTYLPFSSGPHMCPGKDIAKMTVLAFIHHLTTSYTYESAGPDKGVEYNTFWSPIGGYPINVRLRN